jgi:hypothetical protein
MLKVGSFFAGVSPLAINAETPKNYALGDGFYPELAFLFVCEKTGLFVPLWSVDFGPLSQNRHSPVEYTDGTQKIPETPALLKFRNLLDAVELANAMYEEYDLECRVQDGIEVTDADLAQVQTRIQAAIEKAE